MAGIYIKGMEIPKTGEYRCVIRKWGEEITVDLYGDEELCGKLIPVPPHGRLIDADALPLGENVPTVMMHDGEKWLSAYELAMAPIVIPAELPKEETT